MGVMGASETTSDWAAAGRVAVIGAGIAGLSCAFELARGGARVTLLDGAAQVGGLGSAIDWRGHSIERFYHCLLPSDAHLLPLLDVLGLRSEVYWRQTRFAYLQGQRLYPLNRAADLLRFDVLNVPQRLRVGLTGLRARLVGSQGLDDVRCEDWLAQMSGAEAYRRFWRPLLQAKFGDRHHDVPALWFWTRLNREKGQGPETKGYLPGGYRRIAQALEQHIRAAGGQVLLGQRVQELGLDGQGRPTVRLAAAPAQGFDRVVFAAAYPLLPDLLAPSLKREVQARLDSSLDMQGVVNTLFILRRSLSPHYWVATPDDGMPFQGIVETTSLINRNTLDGHHLVYTTRYLHRSDSGFAREDEAVVAADTAALRQAFPDLQPADLVSSQVFRSPYVEPIYTLGYGRRKPPATLLSGRIYLATTSQVYPEVTSWNGSVGLAQQVLGALRAEMASAPARRPAASERMAGAV